MRIIGLRFFTVFGEWGRPDMFLLKFLIMLEQKKGFPFITMVFTTEILHI